MPCADLCPECDGSGLADWLSGAWCRRCDGTGIVWDDDDEYPEGYGQDDEPAPAPDAGRKEEK